MNAVTGRRRWLLVGISIAVLLYATAVGFLAFNETDLVYVGAGPYGSRRVPADSFGLAWDTLRVPASDSVPVLLMALPRDSVARRPWVIYLHGNAGALGSRFNVHRYRLLHEAGFNVLAVEYRGYGASVAVGLPSERGLEADVMGAFTYLTETLRVPANRIVTYGWSLGGGPASFLASRAKIAAVVTEGTFTSLPDVGAEQYPWVPVRLVMRNRFDNLARARTITIPWLVFHARRDYEVPFAHGEALAAANPRVRFVPLAGEHADAVIVDRAVALAALRDVARQVTTP